MAPSGPAAPGQASPQVPAGHRTSAGTGRFVGRVGAAVVCAGGSLLALAGPAFAESANGPAKPLGALRTIGLFVGVPVGAFVLISLLVVASQLRHRSSTEPDLAWYEEALADRGDDGYADRPADGHAEQSEWPGYGDEPDAGTHRAPA